VIVDKESKKIICTAFCNGKQHDFRLFKESKANMLSTTKIIVDTGYLGIRKLHDKSELPKKRTKKNPLTKSDIRKRNKNVFQKNKLFSKKAKKVLTTCQDVVYLSCNLIIKATRQILIRLSRYLLEQKNFN